MKTGFHRPDREDLRGLLSNSVIVNTEFNVIVNIIDLFIGWLKYNYLKSLMNKLLIHFVKKFTFLLKFYFPSTIIIGHFRTKDGRRKR